MTQEIRIQYQKEENERLDKFLVSQKIEELYSRSFIEKLIHEDLITVNGTTVKKSHLLRQNDSIAIALPRKVEPISITPQKIDFSILYEDDFLAVIDKPAGLTVHPARGNTDKTLVNGLVHHFGKQLSDGYEEFRPGIVHRLDKDTSGVLLIAKTNKMQAQLSTMFQNRKIHKMYQTIVVGVPAEKEGTIETFIARSKKDRKKMAVQKEGKKAITNYQLIKDYRYFSHVEIDLITGRTHQIRVHFAHLHCPVLADFTYSSLPKTIQSVPIHFQKKVKHLLANHLQRQALHASQIRFLHPVLQQEITIESPLPEDMQYTLQWLEKNFSDE